MEQDENIDLWTENGDKKLDVKQRRILITQWVGEAFNTLMGEEYSKTRYRCFEKTGCLITADGSEDDKIAPEGLTNYVVPPPLPIQVAVEIEPLVPAPAAEPEDRIETEVDDELEVDETTVLEERIDLQVDRVYKHPLVNRNVTVFYDEWHVGTITWYNKKLDECRVFYEVDNSEDYLKLDDFNGVDVILFV